MMSLESITNFYNWFNKKSRTLNEMLTIYEASCAYCIGMREAGLKIGNAKFNDAAYTQREILRVLEEKYGINDYALIIRS
jgi:hypothetical protein